MALKEQEVKFSQIIQANIKLSSLLEERVSGVVVGEEALPFVQPLLGSAYVDLVLDGSGHGLGHTLKMKGILSQHHMLTNVTGLTLEQVVNVAREGLLECTTLLERAHVLVKHSSDWGSSHMQDLFCLVVSQYFSARSSRKAEQLLRKLIASLCESADYDRVVLILLERVSQHKNELAVFLLQQHITEACHESFESVVKCQENWKYSNLSPETRNMYNLMLVSSDSLLPVLSSTLFENTKVHWPHLMSFTAALAQATGNQLKECVCELLYIGLCEQLLVMFHCALLMARQVCLEEAHISTSYNQWFKTMCGRVSAGRAVQFFFKWLTELVPHEPPGVLKTHLSVLVSTNIGGKKKDYTNLLRARLSELQEAGDSSPGCSSSEMGAVVKDIERAVNKFQQTGTVPDFLLQMRFINKPYYQQRFLRSLLSPSNHGNTQIQALISALKKKNMIPEHMLSKVSVQTDGQTSLDGIIKLGGSPASISLLASKLSKSPTLTPAHIEFIDNLLSRVCGDSTPNWMGSLLTMLSEYRVYCSALSARVKELLLHQTKDLSPVHLTSLALLTAYLWTHNSESLSAVAQQILSALPLVSGDVVVVGSNIQFCTALLAALGEDQPASLASMIVYLKTRVGESKVSNDYGKLVAFSDWINWEMSRGDVDHLNTEERCLYVRDVLSVYCGNNERALLCQSAFKTLCSQPHSIHGLHILLMLSSCVVSPWLQEAIIGTCVSAADPASLHHRIIDVVICLPSQHLLCGDQLGECIKSILSLSCSLVLPLALTHPLKASVEESRIIHASVLCHFPSVLNAQWLNSGPLPPNFDCLVLGVGVFWTALTNNAVSDNISRIKLNTELCFVVMDCCVRSLTNDSPPTHTLEMARALFRAVPESILVCSEQPHNSTIQKFREEFPCCKFNSFKFPSILFQVINGSEELVNDPQVTALVLRSHSTLIQLQEMDGPSASVSARKVLLASPCDAKSLMEVCDPSLRPWLKSQT